MRALTLVLTASLGLQGLAACGSHDELNLFYTDDLVEAPTRTFDMLALSGMDCETVLSTPHADLAASSARLGELTGHYPLSPEVQVFKGIQRNQTFVIDVVGLDVSGQQISRACSAVNLGSAAVKVDLELRALPTCTGAPSLLDLMIVLDTSLTMSVKDPEKIHLDALLEAVLDPNSIRNGTIFGMVAFGHGDGQDAAQEILPPTTSLDEARAAVSMARSMNAGQPQLFDGVAKATEILRARALCGRRPAMLLIASDIDAGSKHLMEDAQIGVFATRGDKSDDIFTFAIALGDDIYMQLEELVPMDVGTVTGAGEASTIRAALIDARNALHTLF